MMGCRDGSVISWTICKQSAPHSRQVTTPTTRCSIFTGWMLFVTPNQQCQSTEGKSYRINRPIEQKERSSVNRGFLKLNCIRCPQLLVVLFCTCEFYLLFVWFVCFMCVWCEYYLSFMCIWAKCMK